ncbi:MAG: P1 family peptidase [Micromonosporaceae bacterium]
MGDHTMSTASQAQQPRRARDLGIVPGVLPTGAHNAITDVAGVHVGHATVAQGDDIRTGVTAVLPTQLIERRALPANLCVGNGYGKLIGATQLVELGEIETPIVLTATLSVFRAADALLTYVMEWPGRERVRSLNPVGAGTGTTALGFKAGIGTSSRVVDWRPSWRGEPGAADHPAGQPAGRATVGVLVQSNFSGVLTVSGVPVRAGEVLPEPGQAALPGMAAPGSSDPDPDPGNSCMIVVATDARLDSRQLGRLATRAIFAMGRVGSDFASGSGDYAVAFSTADETAPAVPESSLDPLFAAVMEATEEALLNSLFMARTTVGFRGRVAYAAPHQQILDLLRAR